LRVPFLLYTFWVTRASTVARSKVFQVAAPVLAPVSSR
jgi:hypothetical protein